MGNVPIRHILGGGRFDAGGREKTGATGATGATLWEDAYVLAEWISRQAGPSSAALPALPAALRDRASWAGLTAVELGAGLGLPSIVCARRGMRTIATDGDATVLALLTANVNASDAQKRPAHGDGAPGGSPESVQVRQLEWSVGGDPLSALGLARAPDLLLATGCVYGASEAIFEALVATMEALAGPHTLVLMVHGNGTAPGTLEMRGAFYDLASRVFAVQRVPQHALHPDHPGCVMHCLVRH